MSSTASMLAQLVSLIRWVPSWLALEGARSQQTGQALVSKKGGSLVALVGLLVLGLSLVSCGVSRPDSSVVVYVSVDQLFSEPILAEFEEETGIQVLAVYDVEAAKTTGLVNRLIAEKGNPQADVFWSGEFAQTILLGEEGVLAPYQSPSAAGIADAYRDAEGYWTGFAGRARVILVNTDLVPPEEYPASIYDLLDQRWPGEEIGIAYPLFGTTATHAAALYAALGPEQSRAFFTGLQGKGVQVLDGNSVVRDLVAQGRLAVGLTDTDDACGAIRDGASVAIVMPDQGEGQLGTLVIPNTVALISGAPHEANGRSLIDFLLSQKVAEELLSSGWSQVSLRPVDAEPNCLSDLVIKGMDVTLTEVYEQLLPSKTDMAEIFVR
jgi:iron(III) transport system substrate-binding protein